MTGGSTAQSKINSTRLWMPTSTAVYLLGSTPRSNRSTHLKHRSKGPFIATQLNSTGRRVELSCVGEVYSDADATQVSLTDLFRAHWLYAAAGSVALPIVGDSWVASVRVSIATQLNSTELDVELICIAINGPLRRRKLGALSASAAQQCIFSHVIGERTVLYNIGSFFYAIVPVLFCR